MTGNDRTPDGALLLRLPASAVEMKVWVAAADCFIWMEWPRAAHYSLDHAKQLHLRFMELRRHL